MRRFLASVLLALFVSEGAITPAEAQALRVPSRSEIIAAAQPLTSAVKGSFGYALITGQESRYVEMHAAAPTPLPRMSHGTQRPSVVDYRSVPRREMYGSPRFVRGEPSHPYFPIAAPPISVRIVNPVRPPEPIRAVASVHGKALPQSTKHAMVASSPTPAPPTTGLVRWWPYRSGPVPGVGSYMANIGTGNVVFAATDIDIPVRGVDLEFQRYYNSQSRHDAENDDGSVQSNFGDGWTNTYDAHLAASGGFTGAVANVVSVYDPTGARYDYTLNSVGTGGSATYTPPVGMQGTTLTFDGSCGMYWTLKNGIQFAFYAPFVTSCNSASDVGSMGRLVDIFGRNSNNYVHLAYSWNGGDSSSDNLSQITVTHQDGQYLTFEFAKFAGSAHSELAHIVRPDGDTIDFYYDSTTGTHLTEVSQPGHLTGALNSQYAYTSNWLLNYVCSPRYVAAASSGSNDGGCEYFRYASSDINGVTNNDLAEAWDWAWENFVPADGTSTPLQPNLNTGYYDINDQTYTYQSYPSSNSTWETQVADTDGHNDRYFIDAEGRLNQTDAYVGNASTNWLITYQTWESTNNNLVSIVEPSGNETNYAYYNGNVVAISQPGAALSQGAFHPTTLISYDQYNNVTAYCDPNQTNSEGLNWNGAQPYTTSNTLCPATAGATRYSWSYSNAEPYGELQSETNPLGYTTTYAYNTYGLPTSATGQQFSQLPSGAPSITPTQTATYNSTGTVATFSDGIGTRSMTYDNFNRVVSTADSDTGSPTTCTWYFPDGTVQATESPAQRAVVGSGQCNPSGNPDAYATTNTYDPDDNLISTTTYYDNTKGVTQYWYDGADRPVEVGQPTNSSGDDDLTRYIWDLSADGRTLQVGTGPAFAAHGNMYKTQRSYFTNGTYGQWQDVGGTAYDLVNRPTIKFAYQPFGSLQQWQTTYDQGNYVGYPTSRLDPMGVTTTVAYNSQGALQSLSFSDSTPSETYTYDADGHVAAIASSQYGTDQYAYDAAGDVTSYQEGTAAGMTSQAQLQYTYYPTGWRSSMTINASALPSTETLKYAYQANGLRSMLNVGNWGAFAWTYSSAGRELTQTDPYTNDTLAANANVSARTVGPLTMTYNNYGQISWMKFPGGVQLGQNQAFTYDPEGEITGYGIMQAGLTGSTTSLPTATTLAYDVRGRLVGQGASAPAGSGSTPNEVYQYDNATSMPPIDPLTGAGKAWSLGGPGTPSNGSCYVNGTTVYDAAGRFTNNYWTNNAQPCYYEGAQESQADSLSYDSLNQTTQDQQCGLISFGACTINSYTWGPSMTMRVFNTQACPLEVPGNELPCTQSQYTLHWDGSQLLFVTDSSGNLVQFNVESLSSAWCTTTGAPYACIASSLVTDRDFSGTVVDWHSSSGSAGTVVTPEVAYDKSYTYDGYKYTVTAVVSPQYPGDGTVVTPPTGNFIGMSRVDGYQIGFLTFQGVRAYSGYLGTWTTPDQYQGTFDNPLSQRAYAWEGNNPLAFVDPSGFDECGTITTSFNGQTIGGGGWGDSWICALNNLPSLAAAYAANDPTVQAFFYYNRIIFKTAAAHIYIQGCAFVGGGRCFTTNLCGQSVASQGLSYAPDIVNISGSVGVIAGDPQSVMTGSSLSGSAVGAELTLNKSGAMIGFAGGTAPASVTYTVAPTQTSRGFCGE